MRAEKWRCRAEEKTEENQNLAVEVEYLRDEAEQLHADIVELNRQIKLSKDGFMIIGVRK